MLPPATLTSQATSIGGIQPQTTVRVTSDGTATPTGATGNSTIYYYPKPLVFSRNLKKKLTTKIFLYDNIGNSTNAMDVTALTQAKIKALTVMAEKLGCSLSQLAIAW